MSKKQTRSTRKNTAEHYQFQQLAFDRGKQKKTGKKKNKIQITASPIKMQQQIQHIPVISEVIEKPPQLNQQQNQTELQLKTQIVSNTTKKRANSYSNQKTKATLHHQAITTILRQFSNHPTYSILTKTRLRPSTKSQIQQINQKLTDNQYTLLQFQIDIDKIFKNFKEKSGLSQQILSNVQYLHTLLTQKIEYLQKNFQDVVESSQANSLSLRRSVRSSKSISKNIRQQQSCSTPKKKPRKQKLNVQQQSGQLTINESPKRKIRQERKKVAPRPKNAEITLQQIANIGYNIRKLQSKDLQQICLTYCTDADERTQGKNVYFSLDLQKFSKPVLFQIEAYVKTILKQRNIKYQQVREQQDQNFVIEDDD